VKGIPEPTTDIGDISFTLFHCQEEKEPKHQVRAGNGKEKQHPHRASYPSATQSRPTQRQLAGTRDWLLAQSSLQGVPQAFVRWRTAAQHFLGNEFQIFPILYCGVP